MTCQDSFIECTSLSFSYDIMGIVTVSYTMIHSNAGFCYDTTITAGGYTFSGYVSSMNMNMIKGTTGWYETHVTLITDTS